MGRKLIKRIKPFKKKAQRLKIAQNWSEKEVASCSIGHSKSYNAKDKHDAAGCFNPAFFRITSILVVSFYSFYYFDDFDPLMLCKLLDFKMIKILKQMH